MILMVAIPLISLVLLSHCGQVYDNTEFTVPCFVKYLNKTFQYFIYLQFFNYISRRFTKRLIWFSYYFYPYHSYRCVYTRMRKMADSYP